MAAITVGSLVILRGTAELRKGTAPLVGEDHHRMEGAAPDRGRGRITTAEEEGAEAMVHHLEEEPADTIVGPVVKGAAAEVVVAAIIMICAEEEEEVALAE